MFGKAPLCVRHGDIQKERATEVAVFSFFFAWRNVVPATRRASISVKFHPDKMLQPPRSRRDQWDPRSDGAESAKSIPRLPRLIPIGEARSNRLSSVIDPDGGIVELFFY